MKHTLMLFVCIFILTTVSPALAGVCADVNNSGNVNLLDILYLINYLYKGGPAPKFISQQLGTVTDIDGNSYQTVAIGSTADVNHSGSPDITDISYLIDYTYNGGPAPNCAQGQVWMAENLKVIHYRNGDAIPDVADSTAWAGLSTGAYCSYNNDENNVATYGRLYNWFAVSDSRNIAPAGWHVPSDAEWKQLERFLGMSRGQADSAGLRGTDEGGKLKENGTIHWQNPNLGATNESGFSALPGGNRFGSDSFIGMFAGLGGWTAFWSSTVYSNDINYSECRYLDCNYSSIMRGSQAKLYGLSVRCIKD